MTRRRAPRGPLATIALGLVLVFACTSSGGETERSADQRAASTTPPSGDGAVPTDSSGEPSTNVGDDATLRVGLHGIQSFDPASASPASVSDLVLMDLLYDTLSVIDESGVAQPDLATFSANADQTVWRFELDPSATFADGTPVTADDVSFSLDRVLAGGSGSLAALRLDRIASVLVAGPTTIDIEMTQPSAVLPELLSSPLYGITSRAAIERALGGGEPAPNASGDYEATFDGAEQVVLDRRSGDGPGTITVGLYPDEGAALDAFLADELDWTTAPPGRIAEASEVVGAGGLVPFHGGLMLGADAAVPPLDAPGLRRAVALGIDRRALVDTVFGPTAEPALGVIPAGVAGSEGGECRGVCGPALDEARALVDAAFPEGQDQPLRLLVDDSESMRGVGAAIERQLGQIGLQVEVVPQDVQTYETLIAAGQQQLFVFGWLGVARTPASHLPPLFDSASPDNVTGLADDGIDTILRATVQEPIASVRATAWRSVEVAILERVPVVPLVQFRTTGVVNPRVSGFVVRADGSLDLSDVAISG